MAILAALMVTCMAAPNSGNTRPYPEVDSFIQARIAEFDRIPTQRKTELIEIADYVRKQLEKDEPANLTFICTHNSRRSHMSQIWAATAAAYYSVPNVHTYSGGTESTAFNPRAVAALQRAGLHIDQKTQDKNPVYQVRYADGAEPMSCFSKVYDQDPNPSADFCAVMTCSAADRACPKVRGATKRVAIPYDDPKAADNTPAETSRYDERCAQIAREMLYVFSKVKPERHASAEGR